MGGDWEDSGDEIHVLAKAQKPMFPWRPANSHISLRTTGLPVMLNDLLVQMLQPLYLREMSHTAGPSCEASLRTAVSFIHEVTSYTKNHAVCLQLSCMPYALLMRLEKWEE